jgi:large subunit ribosomal protein L10
VPNLEAKQREVDALADRLQRAQLTILAEYRGLNVAEMAALRARLRESGGEFRVAKNTLTRRAAQRLGYDGLVPYLVGPLGLAFGYNDPAALAKAINEYARGARGLFVPKVALLGDRIVPPEELPRLAELPTREELLAKLVGGLQAPLYQLVAVLSAPLRGLVGVLEARRRQLEAGEATEGGA